MLLKSKVKLINYYRILFSIIVLFVIVSCNSSMKPESDFVDVTHKDKYIYWLSIYNEQFESYVNLIETSNLSEEEIKMVYVKKTILPSMYSLLEIYQLSVLDNNKNLTMKQQTFLLELELDFKIDCFEREISHTIFELIIKLYPDD